MARADDRLLSPRPPGWVKRRLPWLGCAALGGALHYLSFPPADLWPLAYVALVPLLVALKRSSSYLDAAMLGGVAGLAGCLPALAWLASVTVPGWIGLSVYVSLYTVAAAVVFRCLQVRWPRLWPFLVPCVWVGLEIARARLGPGFPWLLAGYTQYRFLALVQLSALTGVYGVSFVVVFVAAGLAFIGLERIERPADGWTGALRRSSAALALALLVLLVCCLAGRRAAGDIRMVEGPRVGVVQQNIPRLVSEIAGQDAEESHRSMHRETVKVRHLSMALAADDIGLLVWPETTVQVPMNISPELTARIIEDRAYAESFAELNRLALSVMKELGEEMGSHFLIGAPCWFEASVGYMRELRGVVRVDQRSNSALLFSPEGEFMERYDKMHLVPFGEYIPLVDWLPFLSAFTPFQRSLTPGQEAVIFELPLSDPAARPLRFGALICYEDVVPSLVRQFRLRGADFLVNITDEGWYLIPGELQQHLAMAVFRAVETRTTLVRAANTGVSCFIDPRGEIYEIVGNRENGRLRTRNVEGSASAPVRLSDVVTFYVRRGDIFAWLCLSVSVLVLAAGPLLNRLRRHKNALAA